MYWGVKRFGLKLTELAAYAEEKFHIQEQFKWADFPGFSVLPDPYTGKWAALLMRLRDPVTGQEIQRCDIKCGVQSISEMHADYLSLPFRMKGPKWVGVVFDERTEPDIVFCLFDRAVYSGEQRGYTLVLEEKKAPEIHGYQNSALPARAAGISSRNEEIPPRILEMMRMYKYGDGSFRQKCYNFYRQGKFMELYEDSAPEPAGLRHYFPTYHDLDTDQLRGYFAWRTAVRKGEFRHISASYAYIYLYELLNGIGADAPEDSLRKMLSFERGYLDSGIGDEDMRSNLHRWIFDFAVIHGIRAEVIRSYADPELLRKDEALCTLKDPESHSDEEVFAAVVYFAGEKLGQSPAVTGNEARGKRLFAAVWRYAAGNFRADDRDLFTLCFGKGKTYPWHPLANAVYFEKKRYTDADYELDPCRRYLYRKFVWYEERYENLFFDKKRFQGLFHEADRQLRKFLKAGHPLREKADEAWAVPLIAAVIEAEKEAEREAARPKIRIDLSGLERIRQDAIQTRDSLLTEEELMTEAEEEAFAVPSAPAPEVTETARPADPITEPFLSDPLQVRLLRMLLNGENPDAFLREHHLLPSVITDAVNEAFFDEIGDTILECDGSQITIVEDYRDDIVQLLGENDDE